MINGECAQQSSQLTDVEYRLVRVIGSVLGLGWSQLNLNVQTGSPDGYSDDYLGFPVMHFTDAAELRSHHALLCQPLPHFDGRCGRDLAALSGDCAEHIELSRVSRFFPP